MFNQGKMPPITSPPRESTGAKVWHFFRYGKTFSRQYREQMKEDVYSFRAEFRVCKERTTDIYAMQTLQTQANALDTKYDGSRVEKFVRGQINNKKNGMIGFAFLTNLFGTIGLVAIVGGTGSVIVAEGVGVLLLAAGAGYVTYKQAKAFVQVIRTNRWLGKAERVADASIPEIKDFLKRRFWL